MQAKSSRLVENVCKSGLSLGAVVSSCNPAQSHSRQTQDTARLPGRPLCSAKPKNLPSKVLGNRFQTERSVVKQFASVRSVDAVGGAERCVLQAQKSEENTMKPRKHVELLAVGTCNNCCPDQSLKLPDWRK